MFDNLNEQVLSKRRRFFQKFLDHLINIPVIKASNILYDFLTIREESDFNKKKADYEASEGVHKLHDTNNLEGILYSKFNKDLSKQHKILRDYVNINELLFAKLTEQYDVLKTDFEKISNTLQAISEIYKQLFETSEEFFDPFSMANTYSTMKDLNLQWSESYKKQSTVNEEDFKEFFDYYRCELDALKEHITVYQDSKDDYLRYYNSLKNKKEKLFKLKNSQRWEMSDEDLKNFDKSILNDKNLAFGVMCKNETQVVNNKRRQLGVVCHNLQSDFIRMRSYHSKRYERHFADLAGRNKDVIADVFNLVKLLHMNAELEKKNRESEQNSVSNNLECEEDGGQFQEKLKLDDLNSHHVRSNTISKKHKINNETDAKKIKNKMSVEYIRIEKSEFEKPDDDNDDLFDKKQSERSDF